MHSQILIEMEEAKDAAINKILSLFQSKHHIDDIVNTLAYAYLEDESSACRILSAANLSQDELSALLDDEATFKENCEKQMIFEMGEAEYDRKYGY